MSELDEPNVADGKVVRSDLHGLTVRHLKADLGAKEIRRCDIYGRQEQREAALKAAAQP